jgi:hypothetical protein
MPTSVGINATNCVAEEIGWASNGVGLTQKADDLFFRKSLLHVQSSGQVGLDSKSRCYSKSGASARQIWLAPTPCTRFEVRRNF